MKLFGFKSYSWAAWFVYILFNCQPIWGQLDCKTFLSFGNKTVQDIFGGKNTKNARKLPIELHQRARKRLVQLNAATKLSDLGIPASNRLEALKGNLEGFHSIRINKKWRVIFIWNEAGPKKVQFVDYH